MKPTNETKWTPGPWRIVDTKSHCDFTIVPQWQRGTIKRDWDGDYYPIASVSRSFLRTVKDGKKRKLEHPELPAGQALANARLIASAPKLFAALQAMLAEVMLQPSCIRESKTAFAPVIEQARAALDKAREGK